MLLAALTLLCIARWCFAGGARKRRKTGEKRCAREIALRAVNFLWHGVPSGVNLPLRGSFPLASISAQK
jgi:hypothetical protein